MPSKASTIKLLLAGVLLTDTFAMHRDTMSSISLQPSSLPSDTQNCKVHSETLQLLSNIRRSDGVLTFNINITSLSVPESFVNDVTIETYAIGDLDRDEEHYKVIDEDGSVIGTNGGTKKASGLVECDLSYNRVDFGISASKFQRWAEDGVITITMDADRSVGSFCHLAKYNGSSDKAYVVLNWCSSTSYPSASPSVIPSSSPSLLPTSSPTPKPSPSPTTSSPTTKPTMDPTRSPTLLPTAVPTTSPTTAPTATPTTRSPSPKPSFAPTTAGPTLEPTTNPTTDPVDSPTKQPSQSPVFNLMTSPPTANPTSSSTGSPSLRASSHSPAVTSSFLRSTPSPTLAPSSASTHFSSGILMPTPSKNEAALPFPDKAKMEVSAGNAFAMTSISSFVIASFAFLFM